MEQSLPGPLGRLYRRDLIGPIRYSVAAALRVCARVRVHVIYVRC